MKNNKVITQVEQNKALYDEIDMIREIMRNALYDAIELELRTAGANLFMATILAAPDFLYDEENRDDDVEFVGRVLKDLIRNSVAKRVIRGYLEDYLRLDWICHELSVSDHVVSPKNVAEMYASVYNHVAIEHLGLDSDIIDGLLERFPSDDVDIRAELDKYDITDLFVFSFKNPTDDQDEGNVQDDSSAKYKAEIYKDVSGKIH